MTQNGRGMVILLVGYGWFRNIPEGQINNAELIARALDAERIDVGGKSARIVSLIVPVVWDGAFAPVEEAIARLEPDVVLALGTDASAAAMRPEPWGVNWCEGTDASPDDPAKETTRSCPIEPGGPQALRGTLPFEEMTLAMLREGIPAQTGALSDAPEGWMTAKRSTAGRYLCNYMAYRLARLAQSAAHPLRTGFMHVPTRPQYAAAARLSAIAAGKKTAEDPMPPSMPLEMMIRGTRAALRAIASHEEAVKE